MAETKKSKDAFHGFNPYDRPITEKGEIPSCFEFRKWAEFIDIQRLQMYRDMMTELRKSTGTFEFFRKLKQYSILYSFYSIIYSKIIVSLGSAEFCKNSFEDFLAISKFREAAIKTCQDTLRDEIQWQKEHFSGNVMVRPLKQSYSPF